jgi:hypothetical protein
MATSSRLAREQTEKAFAAYLNANRTATPLAGIPVQVRKGKLLDNGTLELENLDEIPLPCVAVACPRSRPHDGGWPVCELHILSLNSVDEDQAATKASARFGFIAELLSEDHDATVKAALNMPSALPDNRVVKNYNVIGFYQTEDMGQETDRHWIDHLVFEVHCNPTDDLNGDGQDDL